MLSSKYSADQRWKSENISPHIKCINISNMVKLYDDQKLLLKSLVPKLSRVAHTCNPKSLEAEAGGIQRAGYQIGLYSESHAILGSNKTKENNMKKEPGFLQSKRLKISIQRISIQTFMMRAHHQ